MKILSIIVLTFLLSGCEQTTGGKWFYSVQIYNKYESLPRVASGIFEYEEDIGTGVDVFKYIKAEVVNISKKEFKRVFVNFVAFNRI